jgi:hypothetical protein
MAHFAIVEDFAAWHADVAHELEQIATAPAGSPMAAASAPSVPVSPASPAMMASTVTPKPVSSPAVAPNSLSRFHQMESTSTGKMEAPVSAMAHRRSASGSVGATMAIRPASAAAAPSASRDTTSREAGLVGDHVSPYTISSARILPSATVTAPAVASAAATTPPAAR